MTPEDFFADFTLERAELSTESLRYELLHQPSGVHVTMVQLPVLNTRPHSFHCAWTTEAL